MQDAHGRRKGYGRPRSEPQEDPFVCVHCGRFVPGDAFGTNHRNHCPYCLWSRHVDWRPGDRRASCRGEMAPLAVSVKRNGEWMLIHRCEKCGALRNNRIAGDDNELLLMSLAAMPLARPPFPLDGLRQEQSGEDSSSESAG